MVESKLNQHAIEAFAESFARKVCDSFFQDKDTISGREIVELTPVKQVNYFVLKILFRKWQKETLRLQSPYFNYRNDEVRKALLSFMNVLSQQISVSREHFEPLLFQATTEALLIVFAPYDFFKLELTGHESGRLNDKYLKNSAKYIKVNQHIFEAYREAFDQLEAGELPHDKALELLEEIFADTSLETEDTDNYKAQFSEVEAVDFSLLTGRPDTGFVSEDDDEDDNDDTEAEEEDANVAEEEDEDESKTVEDFLAEEAESADDELVKFADDEEETPQYETLEELDARPEATTGKPSFEFLADDESPEEDELGDSPLNKRFSSEKTSLHDKLKEEQRPTLAEVHQSQKIDNILASISVNQRYMFVNELFKGENDLFAEAMGKVETCDSFDDAVELLIQAYSKNLEWDMNAPEVKELLKIIFKKFR